MFETLHKAPPDKIFALLAEFRADTRPEKIDLGIGVYKDPQGTTPIMTAVAEAEKRIVETADTKTYVGVAGNRGFIDALSGLVFGEAIDTARIAGVQAPGGTGALWVLMQALNRARPGARIWLSDPTWPNHKPLAEEVGLTVHAYPYFDADAGTIRFEQMLACLDGLGPDDTVLLHGCCHNPTGANPTPEQWDQIAASLKKTGALPLIDLAYLGFGDGLEADAYSIRKIVAEVPEAMVAVSCSKNFGLYRDRAGVAFCIAREAAGAAVMASQMGKIARTSYSQPPDHGAEIVRVILTDPELRQRWENELTAMRKRMLRLRQKLAEAIRERSNSADFDFLAVHRGMFSLLGLSQEQVDHLKNEKAIYMIRDSRINVAGIPEDRVGDLADAILSVAGK